MSYLLKSRNRNNRKGTKLILTALVTVLVASLTHVVFPRLFPSVLTAIGIPIWKSEQTVLSESGGFWGYFMSKRNLYEQNQKLRTENDTLKQSLLSLPELEKENANLQALLGRVSPRSAVLGYVLKKPPSTPYDTLVVDVGSNSGVKVGDRVIVNGWVSVGQVDQVLTTTATVKLYSTPDEKTSVQIGSTTVEAVAIGRGSGDFEATVPRDAAIAQGDIVTLAGMPQSIVGIVEDRVVDPARAFQKVFFRSLFTLSELTSVVILREQ